MALCFGRTVMKRQLDARSCELLGLVQAAWEHCLLRVAASAVMHWRTRVVALEKDLVQYLSLDPSCRTVVVFTTPYADSICLRHARHVAIGWT